MDYDSSAESSRDIHIMPSTERPIRFLELKEYSMDNPTIGKLIAHGRTADVHEWQKGYVIKLFHDWFDIHDIEFELPIAKAVHASGVNAPSVGEIIQVDGHHGLIYEHMIGTSMLDSIWRAPWKTYKFGKLLAELHIQMHNTVFHADVPEHKGKLAYKIQKADALSNQLKTALLDKLESMPGGDRICHGDFHPGNVLLTQRGSMAIDWIDASRGYPLADTARTSIIILGAAESMKPDQHWKSLLVKIFHSAYLEQYFRLHPQGRDEYQRWLPVITGARLSENIHELEGWLVQQAGA